jgi:hypothetical protein
LALHLKNDDKQESHNHYRLHRNLVAAKNLLK